MIAKQETINELGHKITWQIQDVATQKSYSIEFAMTDHFLHRSCQRNISESMIQIVIEYGSAYFKQGLIFYLLGSNNLPKQVLAQDRKRYRNLVVVVSSDDASIITTYRSKNPFKHIKKKSKMLSRSAA